MVHLGRGERSVLSSPKIAVVIPAGGGGTRLWPRSRQSAPKQFLDIVSHRTMLQETADRVREMVPAENLFVITNARHVSPVREQLPDIPPENVVGEPQGRDSAPAIGLMAVLLESQLGEDAVMVVLPADHVIPRDRHFRDILTLAARVAADGYLVTLGIPPTGPDTGFGYIQSGEAITQDDALDLTVSRVLQFKEKPKKSVAQQYLRDGGYFWNAGMYIVTVRTLRDLYKQHLPEMEAGFARIAAARGTPDGPRILAEVFPTLPKVSIDFGISEKADKVAVIPADIGWNDVGSWGRLAEVLAEQHDEENTVVGKHIGVDTKGTLIYSPHRLIATIGLEDMIVIDTPDATLICPGPAPKTSKRSWKNSNGADGTTCCSDARQGKRHRMNVPMADLQAQHRELASELTEAFERVMDACDFGGLGKSTTALEAGIAAMCGARFGLGVNSGTDALLLSLLALGVGPGDEVVTSPFTFFATAETISLTGATPVFADIDPRTYNLDPEKAAAKITPKTKAILPVHLFGQAANMTRLTQIAGQHGLEMVGDGAQAIGATHYGKQIGALCALTTLSFYPTKNLGACGDAGMILTGREDMAERIKLLRFHGSGGSYFHKTIGYCSRLDGLQAALLSVKARRLEAWNDARRRNAAHYDDALADLGGQIGLPCVADGNRHIYHQYTLRVPNGRRDALQQHLAAQGVQSAIYYPLTLHLQEAYKDLGYTEGDLPEGERATREVLSLPVHPQLRQDQVQYVAESVRSFFA